MVLTMGSRSFAPTKLHWPLDRWKSADWRRWPAIETDLWAAHATVSCTMTYLQRAAPKLDWGLSPATPVPCQLLCREHLSSFDPL